MKKEEQEGKDRPGQERPVFRICLVARAGEKTDHLENDGLSLLEAHDVAVRSINVLRGVAVFLLVHLLLLSLLLAREGVDGDRVMRINDSALEARTQVLEVGGGRHDGKEDGGTGRRGGGIAGGG